MSKWLKLFFAITLIIILIIFFREPKFFIKNLIFTDTNFTVSANLEQEFKTLKNHNFVVAYFSLLQKKKWLKKTPIVQDFKVIFDIPQKITFKISEKKPWLSFVTAKKNFLISEDGTILNKYSEKYELEHPENLIIVHGVAAKHLQGTRVSPEILSKTRLITEHLARYFSSENLQIEFKNYDQVYLLKDDILPVKLGTISDINTKFENLTKFLDAIKNKTGNIEYIDLRISNKVIVKYSNEAN